MELFGKVVIYCIMCCSFLGALFSIFKEEHPIGQEFLAGIGAIGICFLPVSGILASLPYISTFITNLISPLYAAIGADPSMAATSIIAVDMGGYQLADVLAQDRESWMMSMSTGFMAGATIVFSIPVALKMLEKEDRPYLALGVMSGFIALPFGVLSSCLLLHFLEPSIRDVITTSGVSTYVLKLGLRQIITNLIPLFVLCSLIVMGLYFVPQGMIRSFIVFGKILDAVLRFVLVACIIEYFTNFFSIFFGSWGFDPIIADEKDINRALEIVGYVGLMLSGAFPMVYIIRTYLQEPLKAIGKKIGLSADATAGMLAAAANALALFAMINKLSPEDKVKTIAFSVCGAFLIGDHLAFCANFQPNMIVPIMAGKLIGGGLAVWVATRFAVRKIKYYPQRGAQIKQHYAN